MCLLFLRFLCVRFFGWGGGGGGGGEGSIADLLASLMGAAIYAIWKTYFHFGAPRCRCSQGCNWTRMMSQSASSVSLSAETTHRSPK